MFKGSQCVNGPLGVLLDQFFAFFQPIEPDEGILGFIGADALAHFLLGADHIQHIVPDLESKAKTCGEFAGSIKLLLRCAAGNGTQGAGSADEPTGFPVLNIQNLLSGAFPLFPRWA